MRVGEAIRLDVPISCSTTPPQRPGLEVRPVADGPDPPEHGRGAARLPGAAEGALALRAADLFVHPAGNRVRYESVQAMFRALAAGPASRARSDRCRPTVTGPHTFAVNTSELVSRGSDVQARLPQLSTFLGHAT